VGKKKWVSLSRMRTFLMNLAPRLWTKFFEVFRKKIRSWENWYLVGRSLESETE